MTGLIAAISTAGIAVIAITAGLTALGIAAAPVVVGFVAITAATAAIITNMEALNATATGIQAGFTVLVGQIIVGFNNAKIATNNLLISMKELGVATLEAVPSDLFNARIQSMKDNIQTLKDANQELIENNNDVGRSFAEIYDEIDAEKMREKIEEESIAALEARTAAAAAEMERKNLENEAKLLQEQEYKNRLQEQNIAAQEAVDALKALELALLEAQQKKFNKTEIVNLKKQIADKKKILTKGFTEEQKQTFKHLEDVAKAEREDEAERLKFKKQFAQDTLSSAISLGKGLVKEGSAAQKALFLIEKAGALASATVNTAKAVQLAAANPPGPPFNAPIVAATAAAGAVQIAAITASAIGLEQGGMVGSAGASRSGDRHPAMLADGELVVPRKNFEEVVAATARQRGLTTEGGDFDESNANPTRIEISFTDDAAEIITARQLENSTLGTDRG
jgi:hypothetical protein